MTNYWNKSETGQILEELQQIRLYLSIGFKKEVKEHQIEQAAAKAQVEAEQKEHKEKGKGWVQLFHEWAEETNIEKKRATGVVHVLLRFEIYCFADLNKYSDAELLKLRNFGQKALKVTKAVKAWAESKAKEETP
jgi:DNA-directed RNA polymerase alpha subunit